MLITGAVGGRPDLLSNSTPPPSDPPSVSTDKYTRLLTYLLLIWVPICLSDSVLCMPRSFLAREHWGPLQLNLCECHWIDTRMSTPAVGEEKMSDNSVTCWYIHVGSGVAMQHLTTEAKVGHNGHIILCWYRHVGSSVAMGPLFAVAVAKVGRNGHSHVILCWCRHVVSGLAMRPLAAVAVAEMSDKSLLSSPAHTMTSTPTHTSCTEGTPSYTTSSPSCSSEPPGEHTALCGGFNLVSK